MSWPSKTEVRPLSRKREACPCPTCFCWGDYGSQLAWEHLSVFPKEEVEGMTGREEGLGISA